MHLCSCACPHTCTHECTPICAVAAGIDTSKFAYIKRMKYFLGRNLIFSFIVLPCVLQNISKQNSACYLLRIVGYSMLLSYSFY